MENVSMLMLEKAEEREKVMAVHDEEEMGPEARAGSGAEKAGEAGKALCRRRNGNAVEHSAAFSQSDIQSFIHSFIHPSVLSPGLTLLMLNVVNSGKKPDPARM